MLVCILLNIINIDNCYSKLFSLFINKIFPISFRVEVKIHNVMILEKPKSFLECI